MVTKRIVVDKANRLYQLPPDIFSFVPPEDRKRLFRRAELLDLGSFRWPISFADSSISEGDWTPATSEQMTRLREATAAWLEKQAGVRIHPLKELYVGGGISGLLLSLGLALIDPGDIAFVSELGLPLYRQVVTTCGGEPIPYQQNRKSDWRPVFDRLQGQLGRVARLLFLNSPHNPTGAELAQKEMSELVWQASHQNIVIVNDAAYYSIAERPPVSLLSVTGGKKVGLELYSYAYTFGLPAYPFGFAAGNRDLIGALQHSANLQRSYFPAFLVRAAENAVSGYPGDALEEARRDVRRSAAAAEGFMQSLSLSVSGSPAVPFLWARLPERRSSVRMARLLLRRSRILVAPGTAFGEVGQGYLRFSLTADPALYQQAVTRVKRRLAGRVKAGEEE